ncbi:dTDP-4-dehydrorhamnose reductase [Thermogutta terrifontis]|uniref:dTDP-4-dehydrorhamnose reductase n=1 Tax=Thermogutta terrifontis TaxID=1331910 RepID=A0A286R9Z8_9BACT|nr:sugar nucleotide-binding protein [Thermogutta terrifontis]ASV72781.1 dTDP-4-dehydrorhamnose reductase [Thermogutta terrifontis]
MDLETGLYRTTTCSETNPSAELGSTPSADVPLPILVTGLAGVAGYHAFRWLSARYPGRVFGLIPARNPHVRGANVLCGNIEDRACLETLFRQYEFAAVLDAVGNCALKPCELEPKIAWMINVEGLKNILRAAGHHRPRIVRLSVDLVFSGKKEGGYVEEDPPDPVTVYGKTMAVAEQILLDTDPTACILRISLPMGRSPNGHAGAIDWIESRFAAGRPATLYWDEIRTPTYVDCLSRVCWEALRRPMAGIFHAGGPVRLSLYQIGQIINRVGGYDPDLLFGIPRRMAGPIPPRAGNVTMDSSKLTRTLGYAPFLPWPFDRRLLPTDREWHRRREPFWPELQGMGSLRDAGAIDKLLCQPHKLEEIESVSVLRLPRQLGKTCGY